MNNEPVIVLRNGDKVKYLNPQSSLIKGLKENGWTAEGEEDAPKRRGRPPKEEE